MGGRGGCGTSEMVRNILNGAGRARTMYSFKAKLVTV